MRRCRFTCVKPNRAPRPLRRCAGRRPKVATQGVWWLLAPTPSPTTLWDAGVASVLQPTTNQTQPQLRGILVSPDAPVQHGWYPCIGSNARGVQLVFARNAQDDAGQTMQPALLPPLGTLGLQVWRRRATPPAVGAMALVDRRQPPTPEELDAWLQQHRDKLGPIASTSP